MFFPRTVSMRGSGSDNTSTGRAAQTGIGLTADAFARTTINVEGLSCGSAGGACPGVVPSERSVGGRYENESCRKRRHDRNSLHMAVHHCFPALSAHLDV